jgi:hypothetical protein
MNEYDKGLINCIDNRGFQTIILFMKIAEIDKISSVVTAKKNLLEQSVSVKVFFKCVNIEGET